MEERGDDGLELAGEVGLGQEHGRACLGERERVLGLVVGGHVGARHEDRRRAGDGQLRAGDGAGAAEREIGRGVGEVHPVEVGDQPKAWVVGDGRPQRVVVALARGPDHGGLLVGEEGVEVELQGAVERAGAERAAHREQHAGVGREVEVGARLGGVDVEEVLAHRVAGDRRLGAVEVRDGRLEGEEHLVGAAREQLVGGAGVRVLLLQHERPPAQRRRQPDRPARVAARAHDHVGVERAHQPPALPEALDQLERERQVACDRPRREAALETAHGDRADRVARLRDRLPLHPVARACERHRGVRPEAADGVGDGDGRVHVPARSAAGEQHARRPGGQAGRRGSRGGGGGGHEEARTRGGGWQGHTGGVLVQREVRKRVWRGATR